MALLNFVSHHAQLVIGLGIANTCRARSHTDAFAVYSDHALPERHGEHEGVPQQNGGLGLMLT